MFKIPAKTGYILDTITKNGYEAYIVGGCVRDILLNKTPHDFDVTTSATPDEIISIFPHTVPTGIKHGTVTVIVEGEPTEVTTFRCDGDYLDARHPEKVQFVRNLSDDLSRRDFTVNAMAYNPKVGLCDLFDGQNDLKHKILRAVGDPEKRFKEDALRILRLFRFAATLNFTIEENTFNAAIKCAPLISKVSTERIMNELKAALKGENFKVIKPLIECGGLYFLGLNTCPDFEEICRHRHNPLLCLYLLFGGKTECDLKLSNAEKNYINSMNKLKDLKKPETKADIKRCLSVANENVTNDFLTLCGVKSDLLFEIIENREPYLIGHLKIKGNDLLKMGYSGNEVGEILKRLQNEVIENPTNNTKARLLKLIQ